MASHRLWRAWPIALSAMACNAALGIEEPTPRPKPLGTAGAGSECTKHLDCIDRSSEESDPDVCVEGRCVPLLSPDCPLALPQTERGWLENLRDSEADPIIFGVFAAMPPSIYGVMSRNYDLALTEISRTVTGIPEPTGRRRRLLAVVCRNAYDSTADFDAALDHLVDDLQVPGILATLTPDDLQHAFERNRLRKQVFFLNAVDAEKGLLDLVDDGLIWHMLPEMTALKATYVVLLERVLRHLEAGVAGAEPVRVALLRADNLRGSSALATELATSMTFNGLSARENGPEHFREVSVESAVSENDTPDYSNALQVLEELEPHVIVSVATGELVTTIAPALEGTYKAKGKTGPFYILSPDNSGTQAVTLLVQRTPGIYKRIAGVNYAAAVDSTAYDAYQARFDAANPANKRNLGLENHYDAAYYLSYAAAAAGPVWPLRGSDLAQGMRRLLRGGPEFTVGPDDLSSAFIALEAPRSTITLNGTLGPPEFDMETGVRSNTGSVWCVDRASNQHSDVLRLDTTGSLFGTFPCFDLEGL